MEDHTIHVKVVVDKKSIKALRVILETLEDVASDFEYRDDVKRAIRAAKHLIRNVRLGVG